MVVGREPLSWKGRSARNDGRPSLVPFICLERLTGGDSCIQQLPSVHLDQVEIVLLKGQYAPLLVLSKPNAEQAKFYHILISSNSSASVCPDVHLLCMLCTSCEFPKLSMSSIYLPTSALAIVTSLCSGLFGGNLLEQSVQLIHPVLVL